MVNQADQDMVLTRLAAIEAELARVAERAFLHANEHDPELSDPILPTSLSEHDMDGHRDTNLVTEARGQIWRQIAGNKWDVLQAKTAGAVLGGDGSDVVSTVPDRSIILTAAGGEPTTTAGCAAVALVEAPTNDVDYWTLDFDTATDESAFWIHPLPKSYSGGTVLFRYYWTAASGSGTVNFSLKAQAYADSDAIDQAYGTAVAVTDTLLTAADVHISAESAALTIGGGPAGDELVQWKITRDVSADNLGVDARLLAIKITYPLNTISD